MSRTARDSPGMERYVSRPGLVHYRTTKRPGMNFSGAKFANFAVIFFKDQKVKISATKQYTWAAKSQLNSSK